jgi:hypothetical protein
MDYYADKSRALPRFVYRNLVKLLSNDGNDRFAAIENFRELLRTLKPKGDWLKLKWTMPSCVAEQLEPAEVAEIESLLAMRRERRNERFLEVFPHCSDEFSLDLPFLDAAFGTTRLPLISRRTPVITIGSCFARNIAVYMASHGYNVNAWQQAEDLNSPFSNAKLLEVCTADDALRRRYIDHWVRKLYPPQMDNSIAELIEFEVKRLVALTSFIRTSELMIVTCGNIIDYFLAANPVLGEAGPAVAPKFLSISTSEGVEQRTYLTHKMREAGAVFRLGTYWETLEALVSQYKSLRQLNPSAHIIFTLSPVPIDSAVGLNTTRRSGAIELDCISKSSLRVALAEFLADVGKDERVSYFPSFEIVRWIAPNIGIPVFGNQDAASRHVSQHVLDGVYRFFLHRYAVDE